MARYIEFLTSPFKSVDSKNTDLAPLNVPKENENKTHDQARTKTQVHLLPTKPHYSMDKQKAIAKKISASERETTIETEYKVGNIVLTFQAGHFEIFKMALIQLYNSYPDPDVSFEKQQTLDGNDLEVSFLYKVYKNHEKMFTVNIYNTKCRIVVNGNNELSFMNDHVPLLQSMIETLKEFYGNEIIDNLNSNIRSTLIKMNKCEKGKQTVDTKCPKCKHNVRSRAVQCQMCGLWVHYKCDKLSDDMIDILEDPDNLYIYRCKMCKESVKQNPIGYKNTHENTHMTNASVKQ